LATSQQAGDEWSIFYSGSTAGATYDYMDSYQNGWSSQPKVYSHNSQWVSPPAGTGWITPVSGGATANVPGGLYAFRIGVGAYNAGETWTLFGEFAADNNFVSAFLVGTDGSHERISGMPNNASYTSLARLSAEGIGITGLMDGTIYDLVMFVNNAGSSPQGFYSNLELVKVAPPPAPIPEPATLAILGLGLAGLGLARRRMKK